MARPASPQPSATVIQAEIDRVLPAYETHLRDRACSASQCLLSLARDNRHTCALHTLEATGDIRQVALWLGHASIRSTEMYLRVDPAKKLEILEVRKPPVIREESFEGVQDQLLALLSDVGGVPDG